MEKTLASAVWVGSGFDISLKNYIFLTVTFFDISVHILNFFQNTTILFKNRSLVWAVLRQLIIWLISLYLCLIVC